MSVQTQNQQVEPDKIVLTQAEIEEALRFRQMTLMRAARRRSIMLERAIQASIERLAA